jgi:dienelactone hydrolase
MPTTRRDFLETVSRVTTLGIVGGAALQLAVGPAAAAAQSGSTETNPPPDTPRDLPATGANLGSLFPTVQALAAKREFSHSFLSGRFSSLEEFKQAGRAKVLEAFAYRPAPVDPEAEVLDRADLGDYIREKIVFSTGPELRVPAYVLIPKDLRGQAPAIVDLHSHGGMFLFGKEKVIDLGRNHPAMVRYHEQNYEGRPTATQLVRRGYVVIVIDALMFGERRILLDGDLSAGWDRAKYSLDEVQRLNAQCRSKESTIVKGLTLAGLTWPGIVTWDDMRTIDYLVTRPEVDPKRIGCVGVSLGGHRSLYLAGLDERIAAACVTGFMSTVEPMIKAHLDIHSFVHFVPGLHQALDLPDVVSLAAPRPLLVQQCSQDGLFPLAGMQAAVDKIAAVYDKAGARDKFTGRFYDRPHLFSRQMQDDAFAFFDAHLTPGRR